MLWIRLLKGLLQFANAVAAMVHEEKLMTAGEARAVAKSMAGIAARLGIGRQITAEIEAMSDSELDAELRGDR